MKNGEGEWFDVGCGYFYLLLWGAGFDFPAFIEETFYCKMYFIFKLKSRKFLKESFNNFCKYSMMMSLKFKSLSQHIFRNFPPKFFFNFKQQTFRLIEISHSREED